MKKTALFEQHSDLGAKIVDFAGYQMPLSYEGVSVEHHQVRNDCGVFDVSHMGEFFVSGDQATALISKISSNDVTKLSPGQAQYSCMPNQTGGIIDDLIIYKLAEDDYMLVVNASNIEKDLAHIQKYNATIGASLSNESDSYALLAIQGPKTIELMQPLSSVDLAQIPFYQFTKGDFGGIAEVIISATGYTGSGGFEIYCKNDEVAQIWSKVLEQGAKPIGLAARDTLRLEMGYCLYGNDIDDTTSPLEAGLGWITKFNCDFVNAANLKAQKENGVSKKLIGFEMIEKGIPRKDYTIVNQDGEEIGHVTSGTMSPSVSKGIGLAYVQTAYAKISTKIYIQIRNKTVAAEVVKPPFYKSV